MLLSAVGGTGPAVAAGIETFLFQLPGCRLIVRGTTLTGTLPAMVLPAAEGTAQVQATCAAGMGEKPNPAVNAVRDATPQFRMRLQNRVQPGLILPDKRLGAIVLVPIGAKREKLLDGDGKKARLSVTMRSVFDTPSSYLIDANASRGRARFFMRYGESDPSIANTTDPSPTIYPGRSTYHVNARLLGATS